MEYKTTQLNEAVIVHHGSWRNDTTFLDKDGNPYDLEETVFANKKDNSDVGGGGGDRDLGNTGGKSKSKSGKQQGKNSGDNADGDQSDEQSDSQGGSQGGDQQDGGNSQSQGGGGDGDQGDEGQDQNSQNSQGGQSGQGGDGDGDGDGGDQSQGPQQKIEPRVGQKFQDINSGDIYEWDGSKFVKIEGE